MLSGDEMLAVGNALSGTPGETHSTEKYCAPAPQRGQTRNGIYDSTRFQEVDAMSATILENRAMDCALHARHQSMGSGGHRTPRARRRAVPIRGFGCSRGHHAVRTRRRGLRMARTVRWRLGSRGPWWRRRPHARTAGRTWRRRGVWSIRGAAWTAVVVVVVVSAIVFSVVVPSVIASEYASSHAQCQADCKDCHRYSLHIASLQGIVVLWGGSRGTAANLFALHHIIRRRDDSFQRRRDYEGDYHAVAT